MCGIAGILNLVDAPPPDLAVLRRMGAVLQHRGPDHFAIERDQRVGLVARRLAIVDVAGGHQPYRSEDDRVIAVFNGEIFNYPELHRELVEHGHRFASRTDGEVLVHLYEEHGEALCERLNGQFAFALWDRRERRLLLARDRVGICPLFYALDCRRLRFASEIKGLLADPSMEPRLDPHGVDHAFTFWAPVGERTAFANVQSLRPGHCAVVEAGRLRSRAYWTLPLPPIEDGQSDDDSAVDGWSDELRAALERRVRLRLQSDVPVGTYLSGGLDSSALTHLAASAWRGRLKTFSIAFDDPVFDESWYQERMARAVDTDHHVVRCTGREIGAIFPEVVWHAEAPLVRTAPAPLYLLSERARAEGIKVVLVGEGADEILLGYHLYKAVRAQEWLAGGHASMSDEDLLRRVLAFDPYYHPSLVQEAATRPAELYARLSGTARSGFGLHELRWNHLAGSKSLYSRQMRERLAGADPRDERSSYVPSTKSTCSSGRWVIGYQRRSPGARRPPTRRPRGARSRLPRPITWMRCSRLAPSRPPAASTRGPWRASGRPAGTTGPRCPTTSRPSSPSCPRSSSIICSCATRSTSPTRRRARSLCAIAPARPLDPSGLWP